MAPSLPQFSAARARSYVFRLPLFTRCIVAVIVALWLAGLQSVWDVVEWGALIPEEIGISTSEWALSSCVRAVGGLWVREGREGEC
jgi:glycosylphosphatidylinositol transamidase